MHQSFMARKSSILKQTLMFSALFILRAYNLINTFLRPVTNPASTLFVEQLHQLQLRQENFPPLPEKVIKNYPEPPKARVFMYDLPKEFATGIIEQYALTRGCNDMSKANYPGHQYMGEWYLYSDIKQSEWERVGSPVIKVSSPSEADLFFVRVFSSLSLIVNKGDLALAGSDSGHKYSDEDTQEHLVEWLKKQEYWERNNGRDHVIVAGDPSALHRIMDKVKTAVLLLSDFGRVRPDQGSLVKDVTVPYSHRISTYHLSGRNWSGESVKIKHR